MDKKSKLLLNLEENIFHLVQQRYASQKNRPMFDAPIILTHDYIESSLLIKLYLNKELISLYNDTVGIKLELLDVDIINLIIKYISTCGRILDIELSELYGVKELDYHPKQTVKYLVPNYILNKYLKGWYGVNNDALSLFQTIFNNIVIPFSIRHMNTIYNIN
jgi:hypothetical protein